MFFLFFSFTYSFATDSVLAEEDKQTQTLQEILKQREEKLWQDANRYFQEGNEREAADSFLSYYRQYPDSPQAEEALWHAAKLELALAQGHPEANWEKVQELFRSYTLDYPKSPQLSDAYFEVANAFYQMHFYREALAYFGLYLNRFDTMPRANDALWMKARILIKIGRLSDAADAFRELGQVGGPMGKIQAQAGMAHIDFAKGNYHNALAVYLKILKKNPTFYIDDPELLYNKGLANLRVGNGQDGRKDLLQFLNIAGENGPRAEILYEVGESYLADGFKQTATKIFTQIVESGEPESRPVVLSRLRLAEEREGAVNDGQAEVQKREIVAPVESDKPFQDVLDYHYEDDSSQDARFELTRRYFQRKEYEQAYSMGKSYLRYKTVEKKKEEVVDIMGQILALRMGKLFQQKKYKDLYQVYTEEYPYVKLYKGVTLLYLTGRALEEMGLYQQASVIYYRAMALQMDGDDQLDLYYHRARTYIASNDLKSAQRLLKYLRKIYAGNVAMGEICYMSGQLREKQNRSKDALSFYRIAVDRPTFADKKPQYARDYLRLLFELDEIRNQAEILDTFRKETWLPPEELQYWYAKLGEKYREVNDLQNAVRAFMTALGEKMPQKNETAQRIRLVLGDVANLQGKKEEAKVYFRQVLEGPNPLMKKLAQQRLTQEDIIKAVKDTQAVMNK